ncbi:NAD(P)/FAD-dependent oxidoreductase [Paraburkholderia acidisoli]|uniref:FAD-dependent oxidoreductase n=1 Tax=Paraburkholderia acidisoli TaxID=2571748 RepID=A0A7Z2GQ58_9BURK|nr:FAD-binding oxidoreductase [Paraburkholderia acidisoli]QGZ65639.1 FAD-dependent oxidoreductase [Paraburkholderia acidisoli]
MSAAPLERWYWPTVVGAARAYAPLEGDADCDVAVVGAGLMGLSCALALAQQGARVTVVEAGQPGDGASGRNGGLVVPSLPRVGPADVLRLLGATHGAQLNALVAEGAQTVFDLIRRHDMQCDAVQGGWLNPAHARELVGGLQARVAAWRDAGSRAQWLDAGETQARIGSRAFHGALFDASGGHVNPYAYTQELARVASASGARIHGASPVVRIARDGARYFVHTSQGVLRAQTVIQCTNALHGGQLPLAPEVSRSFVPLTVFQLATRVLTAEERRLVLPGNEALSDTRNNLFAVRYTADGRMVTGGMAPLTLWRAAPRLLRALALRLERILPALGQIRFDYIWRGEAALTPDFLPRLFEVDKNWFAPLGCNGRGIAMATSLGQCLGEFVARRDARVLPLPIRRADPIRAHTLARYAPQVLLPVGMMQDALRK